MVPLWIGGEPMKYHTFFHQVTAATSWATGMELTELIYALVWLPFALAGCALVFAVTKRFAHGRDRALLSGPGRLLYWSRVWAVRCSRCTTCRSVASRWWSRPT